MIAGSLRYYIALSQIKNLSHANAKKLIAACGSPEELFLEKSKNLNQLKLTKGIVEQIKKADVLKVADVELNFLEKNNITAITIAEEIYPFRLRQCEDSPLVIYMKGKADLNSRRIISVVETRDATNYGLSQCNALIRDLSGTNSIIVSGLAYGIDTCAHESALKFGLDTIAVLGHGLNKLYPPSNRKLAKNISEQGCLLSDFSSTNKMIPGNFPSRNRIIAGISDVCVVVESKTSGGSLITADLANSYNREVCAFPGRSNDIFSSGCNHLIKTNRAALIDNAEDLLKIMNWDLSVPKEVQQSLFDNFNKEEKEIIEIIHKHKLVRIDELSSISGNSINKTASILLQLEFKNAVKSMPGKLYSLLN